MRALALAFLLLGVCASYFVVRACTTIVEAPPFPAAAGVVGLAGLCILVFEGYSRVDRRLNRLPKPPYFVIEQGRGGRLELDVDGSYESCQRVLAALTAEFDAKCSPHLEVGPRSGSDKDKGYWNVQVFGQEFFVMRDRGSGLCIWGPEPHATGLLASRREPSGRTARNYPLCEKLRGWMRRKVSGMGPEPPADPAGFLQLAAYFQAVEFQTWQRKLARCFWRM